jgi:hypothetical protein
MPLDNHPLIVGTFMFNYLFIDYKSRLISMVGEATSGR